MSEIDSIILNGVEYELSRSGGDGVTTDLKAALDQLAQKAAYIDENGQTYYDALHAALYPPANLTSITCVYTQSGTVYDTDTLDSLKTDLVVTAHFSDSTTQTVTTYTLSGTLTEGTSTITVGYGGKTTNFNVTVTSRSTYITTTWTGEGTNQSSTLIDARNSDVYWTFPYIAGNSHYASGATTESDFIHLKAVLFNDSEATSGAGYYYIDSDEISQTQRTDLNCPKMPVNTQTLVAPHGYYVRLYAIKRAGFASNGDCLSFLNENATTIQMVAVEGE